MWRIRAAATGAITANAKKGDREFEVSGHRQTLRSVDNDTARSTTLIRPATHGIEVCTDVRGNLFAWTVMRVSNHLNVFDLQTYRVVRTHALHRPWSRDPKPDLAILRDGRLFVSLRGPQPLTAINTLESADRTPGVAVLSRHRNCQTFSWGAKDIAPIAHPQTTVLADGSVVTIADRHGLVVVDR